MWCTRTALYFLHWPSLYWLPKWPYISNPWLFFRCLLHTLMQWPPFYKSASRSVFLSKFYTPCTCHLNAWCVLLILKLAINVFALGKTKKMRPLYQEIEVVLPNKYSSMIFFIVLTQIGLLSKLGPSEHGGTSQSACTLLG